MANPRTNPSARLQQILLGGRSAIPSLKLESDPPPDVKAFIDRVIKSPLHDIAIPLSGFRWEYNKGNFHHWRPLFIHFDTYFKTYLSGRKDLLLTDGIFEDDPFPKHSVLQILRVMQIILDNCHNKSSFGGLEHFKLLLSSTDPDILIASLETLSALVRINLSKLHGSVKPVGCGSLNNYLLSLAQGWGSKEEGLGLFSCVVANERSQHDGLCLFPMEVEDACSSNQYRLGSTLHFEFHSSTDSSEGQRVDRSQSSHMHVIHISDLHLRKDDDLTILKQCIDEYKVPNEHRFSLLTRIRYAHAFHSSRTCRMYSRICILAFIVLVQSNDAQDELVSFFAHEPEYTNELIRLVRSESSVPGTIKALSMFALGAQLAAYTSSHERARILSGSSIISAGGNRMVLLTVLQKAILSLENSGDPTAILFVEALLQFFLLHVLSSSNSGSAIRGSGMVSPLLPLLRDTDPTHVHLVYSAVKILQKLMEYSNPAVTLFKDLGGVELLVQRLQTEVSRVIDVGMKSNKTVPYADSFKPDDDALYSQKRLIKILLKALGSATYSPANSQRSQNSNDNSLPGSLSLIFSNAEKFGGDIYFSAVTLMSEMIHKDPTCFNILVDFGLPDAFLSSVVSGILPSSKALICIPGALGAICLNAKGLEAVKETAALRFLIDVFTTKKYLVAMNEGVVLLANAVEELLRHVSSLRSTGVEIIIEIIDRLACLGENKCHASSSKVDEDGAMEVDVDDKESRGRNLVGALDLDTDGISNDHFIQLCIFHTMVLVHRTMENSETCRLFVEKKGIDAMMKLLLLPCIAESTEATPIALHGTVVFKGFAQHHSAVLAQAFCSSLRDHLHKALSSLNSVSGSVLLNPKTTPDCGIFSPLFVIEFLLFLAQCKDHRWMTVLLTEFGNGNKDVLEDIGQLHREVLWQNALLEDARLETEVDVSSAGDASSSESGVNDSEEQRFSSLRQYIDPLLRRRSSGWSMESQFLDLISMYRDIGRAATNLRRPVEDLSANLQLLGSSQTPSSSSADSGSAASNKADKQKSYYSSCRDLMRSLSYHISHLFLELGKAALHSSRRGADPANISPAAKSVITTIASVAVEHLNFREHGDFPSSTKCRYLGKVIDFIDVILMEKPDSCNPVLVNCFFVRGVVERILNTFEAVSQLLFSVNKPAASPMETDDEISKQDVKEETDNSWIYLPLASYGGLMDHLVTSSFIISSSKQLLEQPIVNGDVPFPGDAETLVKVLQSKVLKAVLPIWNDPRFTECKYEFIAAIISVVRHVYSGVEVINISGHGGIRSSGPPPDEATISLIVEMGFSRSRAEEALRQVGTNSVELATDWLFSHPEEPQEDDELARALKLSLGNADASPNENATDAGPTYQELELTQLPPVEELLSTCIRLLQANESFVFPVRDLLVTIATQKEGECRSKVVQTLADQLKTYSGQLLTSSTTALSAVMHVLALVLHGDAGAREVASNTGLIDIVFDILSQWDPELCSGEKALVPKWVTASFLAVDQMLQINPNFSPEIIGSENRQTSDVNNDSKMDDMKFSLGLNTSVMKTQDKKRFIEIACKCIKAQLPSDTMHAAMQLCATLTKDHPVAVSFLDSGGLRALLRLPTSSLFPGFDSLTAIVVRHILEDPQTLQQAMESEIKHTLSAAANRHSNGRLTARHFVQSLSSVISRDPEVFMKAAHATCQIEMAGERQFVVLLKDREKEKVKEKASDKEKQLMADGKPSGGDAGPVAPEGGPSKLLDSSSKSVKSHRKPPQSFTSVIELLLDDVVMFMPPANFDDLVEDIGCTPSTDMEIDNTFGKGKGKAVASSNEVSKAANGEASASLAKSVFILKLLTEILMTYTSSIHVILRRDAEISSFRGSQKGCSSSGAGNGVFHHILHEFLAYNGIGKKDKKSDGNWRQKLATRANQFLVASCVRSTEGRKRIFSEVNNIFMDFVESSCRCKAPDSKLHAYIDLLNDILAGRSATGAYISSEASVTFIDAGLVRSLTGTLQVLDLDHADSSKVVTGIIKALELVTKEHAHSTDHGSKGDPSVKASSEQNEQMRIDSNGNRFLPLERASQPDHREMVADQMATFNAAQTSVFSDSVTDDMDHDRDMEGGFTPEEDDFMHEPEPSEAGRSLEDGVSTVEISFEIPRNVEDNMGEEDGDEDMSGDDAEGDGEEDDEDDEENNDLEEDDVHHLSHPDTDQEEHEIDEEEFDEDVEEEDDEDEDDDDGVILRLEEGINGINVFDHIELFGPGGNNFHNDTLRVMPLEVFGSRRQGRSASIYNLLGRGSGDHGFSAEHPLLAEPSSIRQLVQQRQPENAVDAAFSDRNPGNTSSRLDSVFRSLRNTRHHRYSMWADDYARQRGGSSTSAVPQGIEELLVSHLRRPTPGPTSENNVAVPHHQETNEPSQLEARAGLTEDTPSENMPSSAGLPVQQPSSAPDVSRNADARPADGGLLVERERAPATDQAVDMQYDRNDATVRDMEAVSLESGGSSATLGESLRSLDVEIGSADGHDDGERHGEQAVRVRRPAGAAVHQGNREISLESVSEVPSHPTQEAHQDHQPEEQPVNRNADSSSIDPTFLEALPEELRAEVLSAQQNQGAPSSNDQPQATGDIDPEFLAALPPDIRAEVLAQQQAQRLHQSQELEGQPVEMDTVSIIATFPSELREEVLLTSPESVLASLTPALVAEANLLRERFAHRYHGGNNLFSMYPRSRRGEISRRGDTMASSLDRGGTSRRSLGSKIVEAEGAPLVDTEALRAMIRLLRVVQPLYKGQLQKLLLNLCVHHETRSSLVRLLMDMLMLDVQGNGKSSSSNGEPPYRLYGCPSHISYSRPQFSNGVPPLVSRRILETLKYLAQYHPNVAKLLLHFKLPTPSVDNADHGRGKAIMIVEDDNAENKKESGTFVLLLSLLNQPLYLRSIAHLEQLLSLLDVIVGSAENDLDMLEKTSQPSEPNSAPGGSIQDASTNMDLAGPSAGDDGKSSAAVTTPSTADGHNASDTCSILVNLPQSDLQQLCSLLAREGLSDSAYVLVADVLKKLVAIVPDHCHLFIQELANAIQNLSLSAVKELQKCEETEKAMLASSSSDGTAILRVLQALSSLASTLHEKKTPELQEKDRRDALSVVSGINATLEPLWLELSNCISRIESSSESISDFASKPTSSVLSSTSTVPPLPMGTQNILPYIESFFVTCEKLHPGQSAAIIQDVGTSSSDMEDATAMGGGQKTLGTTKSDERHHAFVRFSEKHRKLLNAFVRQNPGLIEKSFSLLLKVPRFIDFDNKRAHFRSKIKHQHDHHHSSLRISVRRAYILEDSYHQLRMRSPQELKGRLTVHFQGEEGIDAGGLTREWYQLLSRVIFDKGALLFTTVGNQSTFQPNPNSVFQTEHLSYFKFVGRVVGKALFDSQLLDVHFTRSFYKHILGVKVTYHDIEAIDPDYYKNLKWMLENDISDMLGLTFSIDADEEKLILYERSEVTDYELKPGGRNIRVTEENKHEYVDLVAEHRLTTAIRPQINAFMEGFNDLIPKDLISIFNDKELELLISGLPDIDLDDLRANAEYSGYTNASPVIQWFWEVIQGFSKEDKARLLQFVTGTSKVPLEGFSALQGISGSQRFQIHKAYGSPDHLPSAHTCFNQLDLPEYPTKEQLQERLLLAIHEANEGFGFG